MTTLKDIQMLSYQYTDPPPARVSFSVSVMEWYLCQLCQSEDIFEAKEQIHTAKAWHEFTEDSFAVDQEETVVSVLPRRMKVWAK